MSVVFMKRLQATMDFASITFDQQNRLLKYEVIRELGVDHFDDGGAWTPPVQLTMRVRANALDAATWTVLKQQRCGSRMTLAFDTSLSEWNGDYELVQRQYFPLVQEAGGGSGSASLQRSAGQQGYQLQLMLRTYSEDPMTDTSDTPTFATVPGADWSALE